MVQNYVEKEWIEVEKVPDDAGMSCKKLLSEQAVNSEAETVTG